jgi:hypothetical protein
MRRQYGSSSGALRMGCSPAVEALQSAVRARQFSNLPMNKNKSIVTKPENR